MSDEPLLECWDPALDGELSEFAMRRKLESRGFACATWVYPPSTHFPPHRHADDKWDAVLSGRFRITLYGRDLDLGPGDCVFVPRGVSHSASVLGTQAVVSIDAVRVRG